MLVVCLMAEIRLELFDDAPPPVRALLSEAQLGRGPLVWLTTSQGRTRSGKSYSLLRGYPPLAHDVVGWAVGIAMFDDDGLSIASLMERESLRGPASAALAALANGVRRGVPMTPNTWKCVERVLKLVPWADGQRGPSVPPSLLDGLHVGLTSDSAVSRGIALRIAQLGGAAARRVLASAVERDPRSQPLQEALAALGGVEVPQPNEPDLLARLLVAWKDTFDPQLLEPIRAAGAEVASRRGPLKARSKGELEGAWLAVAAKKDAGDVDRLLGTPWPGAWKVALQRLRAFDGFPLDPRVARGLVEHAARYTSFPARAVKTTAARLAAQHLRAKMGDAPEALVREGLSRARGSADLAPLWAAFWQTPNDPARRLVLADALTAANDPRGEFITLQVALDEGRADATAEKRAKALLTSHLDTWSGALPGVDRGSRVFRRGFLSALRLKPERDQLKAALDALEWRTVERLELSSTYTDELRRVVGALLQRLPCLQTILVEEHAPEAFARELGGVFPTVKMMGCGDWIPVRRLDEFPSLEFVVAHAKDARVAFEAARRSELRGLVLWSTAVPESLVAFEKYELPELRLVPAMKRDLVVRGWTLRLRRSEAADRADLSWAGRYSPGTFTELSTLLAARGRTSLRVSAAPPVVEKVRAEAEAQPSLKVTFDSAPVDPLIP